MKNIKNAVWSHFVGLRKTEIKTVTEPLRNKTKQNKTKSIIHHVSITKYEFVFLSFSFVLLAKRSLA